MSRSSGNCDKLAPARSRDEHFDLTQRSLRLPECMPCAAGCSKQEMLLASRCRRLTRSSYQEANYCGLLQAHPELCSGVHAGSALGGLLRKPGPRDRQILHLQCAQLDTAIQMIGMPAKLTLWRSRPPTSDIRPVDPISPSHLIASQSQLLPSPCRIIGAKPPLILARVLALAPTHRPQRLQEK